MGIGQASQNNSILLDITTNMINRDPESTPLHALPFRFFSNVESGIRFARARLWPGPRSPRPVHDRKRSGGVDRPPLPVLLIYLSAPASSRPGPNWSRRDDSRYICEASWLRPVCILYRQANRPGRHNHRASGRPLLIGKG